MVRASSVFVSRLLAILVPSVTMVGIACSAPNVGTPAESKGELIVKRTPTALPKKDGKEEPAAKATPTTKRASVPPRPANTDTGPRTACTNDTQCGDGRICEGTVCIAGCRNDVNCGAGASCINRQCVAKNESACAQDAECPLGAICTAGQCISGCHTTADCAIDDACFSGTCIFSPEPTPSASVTTTPTIPTSTSTGTGSGNTGSSSGTSGSSSSCVADFECDIGKICVSGRCLEGCKSDGDCFAGQKCTLGSCGF